MKLELSTYLKIVKSITCCWKIGMSFIHQTIYTIFKEINKLDTKQGIHINRHALLTRSTQITQYTTWRTFTFPNKKRYVDDRKIVCHRV